MLVLVEGVDGSAKSQLIKELTYKGYLSCKPGFNASWFDLFSSNEDKIMVCDRCFISDIVYRIEDNKPRQDISLGFACDLMRLYGAKIIYCKNENSFDKALERGEDNVTTKERSDRLSNIYDIVMSLLNKFVDIPVYEYDYTKQNVQNVIDFIEEDN